MAELEGPIARIVYWRLSGFDGKDQFIGGVETYLLMLADCCRDMGIQPILYQCARVPFERTIGSLAVKGVQTPTIDETPDTRRVLSKAVFADLDLNRDILIFGADQWSVKTNHHRSILIQHGIGWDKPIQYMTNKAICWNNKYFERLKRLQERRRWLRSFENCRNRVCTDYNFLNWYRTYRTLDHSCRIWVIPNATPLMDTEAVRAKIGSNKDTVEILFARRFERFRGTRLMAEVAQKLLLRFQHVRFTFAGDGSDKEWLLNQFNSEPRVAICKIDYGKRMNANYAHDIVVIPSYGSEGTSMSALESMGAGCVTVATDSGGITNLILNGYNGVLITPDAGELENKLTELIQEPERRRRLASAGFEVAKRAFSAEKWKSRWRSVIEEISNAK